MAVSCGRGIDDVLWQRRSWNNFCASLVSAQEGTISPKKMADVA